MIKIDGKKISEEIVKNLKDQERPNKFLALFAVGNDTASEKFISQKKKTAEILGIDFRIYNYPEDISSDEFKKRARKIVMAKRCGGAMIQLPLPQKLNHSYLSNLIPPQKDVEISCEKKIGSFYNNRSEIFPPSVQVIREIFYSLDVDISSFKKIGVVGQGSLVGRPVSSWFLGKVPEVICFDKGSDFSLLKECDLVILGTGSPGLIKADLLKDGAGVIDFGYGFDESAGKISGDLDEESIKKSGKELMFYTPTPGGTGPILVASLFKNFYILAEKD